MKPDIAQLDDNAIKDLAKLALELAHDEKTRPVVNDIMKRKMNRSLPDIEMNDLRAEIKAEREAEKQEREVEKMKIRLEAQREALRDRYDDDAIGEIEKIMTKEGISNYATAAKLYAADLKPADPTPDIKSGVFQMPKFDMKDMNNLRRNSIQRAYEAVDELKKQRVKR